MANDATASTTWTDAELAALRTALAGKGAAEVLAWADATFGADAALASSFGVEDVALLHLAAQHAPHVAVFTLDTGRLHPETYEVMERVRTKYPLPLSVFAPERAAVEELERTRGFFSFRESIADRKACCGIRKVEPLRRALARKRAWITGLRREQSPTRGQLDVVERDDANGGLLKINPLADWTEAQVWEHVRAHKVPYNALHDEGFPSIGCAPCTRAVKPGEDVRAGRWWWESPEHKECGLHDRRRAR